MEDSKKYTILAVDDAKDSLMLLEFDLVEHNYDVLTAESGEEALEILKDSKVSLILLDMYMPGLSGLSTLEKIKSQTETSHIPVIMLSASGDEEQIVSALEYGADDYVTKPYIPNILLARMKNSLRFMEKTFELEALAKTDYLTKLNNRGCFKELVGKSISQAKRTDISVSIAMFDLDFFKRINDSFGHLAGDKALIEFAYILRKSFRDYDIIGRIGGEEFAVCLPNTGSEDAFIACERCREMLEKHVIEVESGGDQHCIAVTVSIGITSNQGISLNYEELLRTADLGLYRAKKRGRNQSIIEHPVSLDKINTNEVVNTGNSLGGHLDENKLSTSNKETIELQFPGIDYANGVINVLGDENLYAEILIMFYQDHGQDADNIDQAINDNNYNQLQLLVHTLKGVACSIGALELFELCKALDLAIRDKKHEEYHSLFEPVKQELIRVIAGIKNQLMNKR